jgi:hypothetical protein
LAAQQWSGAYYVAGYSLECALKSCILAFIDRSGIIFKEKKFAEKCWTHDLESLLDQAQLKSERDNRTKTNPDFGRNWAIVKDWSEESRYQTYARFDAQKLFNAITDQNDGVLTWIKAFW